MLRFCKRSFFLKLAMWLFIFMIFINWNVGVSFSQQKRNVYMLCSKSYFDRVYSGTETETLKSPFAFPFYVSKNPEDFFIAGFETGKLVFYYTNSKLFSGVENIKIGTTASAVSKSKLNFIDRFIINKGFTTYSFEDANLKDEYDVAIVKNLYYLFLFYDRLSVPNVVAGIFMVKKSVWDEFLLSNHLISSKKDLTYSILSSFERINYLHLNSIRAYLQKPYFEHSSKISKVSKLHSQNMAKYNFFSHTDIFGKTPQDRFKAAEILYLKLGENIAMGTKLLPFFANHLLLNSKGHRQNIEESFSVVGAGCAVDPNYENVYYTQNFAVLRN